MTDSQLLSLIEARLLLGASGKFYSTVFVIVLIMKVLNALTTKSD